VRRWPETRQISTSTTLSGCGIPRPPNSSRAPFITEAHTGIASSRAKAPSKIDLPGCRKPIHTPQASRPL